MPDLRAHGDSAKPYNAAAYPPDVLTDDGFALVDHLGLSDYDLVGHSLGGRTAARMLIKGATPRRAVISGQGLEAMLYAAERTGWYRKFFGACGTGTFEPGSDEQETEDWLRSNGGDPKALSLALDSWVSTTLEELASVTVPVLVLAGAEDWQSKTAKALADALQARHAEVPGDHFTAVKSPEFWEALTGFIGESPLQEAPAAGPPARPELGAMSGVRFCPADHPGRAMRQAPQSASVIGYAVTGPENGGKAWTAIQISAITGSSAICRPRRW